MKNIDFTGAEFQRSMDAIESAQYDAMVRDRAQQERVTRNRLRRQQDRETESKRVARAEERDHENREQMKQIKAAEKQRCINAGMTASDFEQTYWPKRKFEIIEGSINAHASAQATDGMYANIL